MRFSGSELEPLCGSGSFSLEHWPKVQKFKKERGHNADCPKAHIVALIVDCAGLLHLHKARFFEQSNSPFTTALADTGITGRHIADFAMTQLRPRVATHLDPG